MNENKRRFAKMDRRGAIKYLDRKGWPHKKEMRKFTEDEELEIKRVMKQGEIYGDPLVVLNE